MNFELSNFELSNTLTLDLPSQFKPQSVLTHQDFIVTPIWFLILLGLAYFIRPMVTTPETRKYFLPGLLVKFFGAIAIGLIYQFYYSWGDTFTFFSESRRLWTILEDEPISFFRILFQSPEELNDLIHLTSRIWSFRSPSNFVMVRILSLVNLLTFKTYGASALIYATFSFSGSWAFYTALYKRYNNPHWSIAACILFIPSVVVWGSGIFKDTLTFGGLMWLSWAIVSLGDLRGTWLVKVAVGTLASWLILRVKSYILVSFLPLAVLYIVLVKYRKISSRFLKIIFVPFFLVIGLGGAYYSLLEAGEYDAKYSIENIALTAQVTAYDIAYGAGQGGSTYNLGKLDGTLIGMIKLVPKAIAVSLFRPFLWEISNPLMFLSAVESTFMLFVAFRAISKRSVLSRLAADPFILFCLIFTLLFASAVGLSSYNFGTLSRYKIPMLPFFGLFLALLSKREK